ncbi:hypothetical protein SeMB42_g06324 [Synchytrium endobioticum]|uniref:Uncharacterized protein n=1 Tax=Synchytrium endobioticum TaxID=286115 RepID=A0A507CLR0_9FUNG|nr:hypothetical protein SeMB42_g06324 [Synchytrium endobioticum]
MQVITIKTNHNALSSNHNLIKFVILPLDNQNLKPCFFFNRRLTVSPSEPHSLLSNRRVPNVETLSREYRGTVHITPFLKTLETRARSLRESLWLAGLHTPKLCRASMEPSQKPQ